MKKESISSRTQPWNRGSKRKSLSRVNSLTAAVQEAIVEAEETGYLTLVLPLLFEEKKDAVFQTWSAQWRNETVSLSA